MCEFVVIWGGWLAGGILSAFFHVNIDAMGIGIVTPIRWPNDFKLTKWIYKLGAAATDDDDGGNGNGNDNACNKSIRKWRPKFHFRQSIKIPDDLYAFDAPAAAAGVWGVSMCVCVCCGHITA